MNKFEGVGHLASEPDLQYVGGGQVARCTFRMAFQRRFVNQQGVREADFLTVVCWKGTAESAARYLKKGSMAAVSGSVQVRSYEKDGAKRYVTEVIADEVEFLSRSEEKKEAAGMKPDELPNEFVEVEDDELPF